MKSTQFNERLVLITEPIILQVSLVNINVMTRVSVFKHPLIVHPIDAHYLKKRVLLTDIGRTEIQQGIKEINMENNEVKYVNTDCKLPFGFCSIDKELEQINDSDFSGHTVRQLNISDLSAVISGIHDQEGHKDGRNGTLCQPTGLCSRGRIAFILLNAVAPREAYGFKRM